MKTAVLGMGNIGGGVVDVIMSQKAALTAATGKEIDIQYILDLRDFPEHPLGDRVVHSIDAIVNDPELELVFEAMGGSHPAYEYTVACLRAGKHVVTSNKEVVANYGDEFTSLAREHGVHYLFEASVGGGIPLIRPITSSLASETVKSINGIVNGTTNYILTRLSSGDSFDEALASAQRLGYAEANPSADVDAIDAQRKICILSALATGRLYDPSALRAETIRNVTPEDMAIADALGGAVKLIAHADFHGKDNIFAAPCFVPYSSPLSHIADVYNGVLVDASVSGELMFFGRGAGKYPTAGSMVADLVAIASGTQSRITPWMKAGTSTLLPYEDHICRHFLTVPTSFAAQASDALSTLTVSASDKLVISGGYYENKHISGLILPEARHGDVLVAAEAFANENGVRVAVYRVI